MLELTGGMVNGRRMWLNDRTSLFAIAQDGWPDPIMLHVAVECDVELYPDGLEE